MRLSPFFSLHALVLSVSAVACAPASALERSFPPESVPCLIIGNGFPAEAWIATPAGRHPVAPSLAVRDAQNRFITLNQLPKSAKARCVFDDAKNLKRVWLLNDEELASPKATSISR